MFSWSVCLVYTKELVMQVKILSTTDRSGKKMEARITKGGSTKRYQETGIFYLKFCHTEMMQVHSYYAINISMHFSEYWDASKNESLNPVFFIHSALSFLSRFKFSKLLKTSFMKITLFFNDNGLWKSTIQKYMVVFFFFFFFQRVAFYQIGLFQNFRLNTDQILSVRT